MGILTKEEREKIARTYFLGVPVREVSEEYGMPAAQILMIAKRYDAERYKARPKTSTGGRKRLHIAPPPVAPVIPAEPQSDRYTVEHDGMRITLPMISILRKAA